MVNVWKSRAGKVWIIVSSLLVILMITVCLVATQVPLLYGTLKLVLGDERLDQGNAIYPDAPVFVSEYDSKEASVAANNKLSQTIAEEGIVLLKNEDVGDKPALPLADKAKISVFGKNSVNMVYGGSGSGGRSTDDVVGLYAALTGTGLEFNPHLKAFYDDNSASGRGRPATPNMGTILTGYPTGETPLASYPDTVKGSYGEYNAAAVVVVSRIGGEGYDLPRTMFYDGSDSSKYDNWNANTPVPGAFGAKNHYLELDKNEADMIAHVCDNFDKVVVVINSGTSMELGFLDKPDFWTENGYADCSGKIAAALWAGNPGGTGNNALANILAGKVNPSGRTVDTFVRDFETDPSWYNFGNNLKESGNEYFIGAWGAKAVPGRAFFERYEEGIYVGYRYWETRNEYESGLWYDDNVVYPFGYGLSYETDFSWEIVGQSYTDGSALPADAVLEKNGEMQFKVKVTNNGKRAGKDVVQLYYTPQYYPGEIEKPFVVLGDFAKTETIAPGDSAEVTLKLKVAEMASYDYSDANGNGFKGYELDAGDYLVKFQRSAHECVTERHFSVVGDDFPNGGFKYDKDGATGNPVVNRFDDVSNYITDTDGTYTSRDDFEGTLPVSFPYDRNLNVYTPGEQATEDFFRPFYLAKVDADYDKDQPWYTEERPETDKRNGLVLADMIGLPYNDKEGKWERLLDQLSVSEMDTLIGVGAFSTKQVNSVRKPMTKDFDGPGGFVIGSFMSATQNKTEVCFFPCESLIAATWSKALALEMGKAVGEEGLWGSEFDGVKYAFSGWYAPAVNLHRSQFGGRNFEYYSEDSILSGKLAAAVCKGAKSKGTNTFVKHFAVNDQETNRSDNGIAMWLNEQSLRELYLKPFEIAVKEGGTLAMMSSFNRIGTEWAGGSYRLLTEVLRGEWGFEGMVITDYNNGKGSYMDLDVMIRAGGDLNLFQSSWLSTGGDALTPTHVAAMRKASHNILYAVANSNAMNNPFGPSLLPVWVIVMILVCVGIALGLGVWGFFVIRSAIKKQKLK